MTNIQFTVPEGTTEDYAKMLLSNFYLETNNEHVAMKCALLLVENTISVLRSVHDSVFTYNFNQSYIYVWWKDVYDFIAKGEMTCKGCNEKIIVNGSDY